MIHLQPIDRSILRIAIPSIISNITVPLLGLVDITIVGHIGDASYIGAIAVGGMIFNVIYWVFGFLRMGTSGMTSQAHGRDDRQEMMRILCRSFVVALSVALLVLIFRRPLFHGVMRLVSAEGGVVQLVDTYFNICVWGAPAVLCLHGLTGWFIGMQNTRIPMFVSIMQNIVNIAASLIFVCICGMSVDGVALGTLVAQYAGFAVSFLFFLKRYRDLHCFTLPSGIFLRGAMMRFFRVNSDIFIRTLFLVAVSFFFLSAGASQGTVILAVNTLLMQLFTLFSYVMDGFAYAGEALCGHAKGAGNLRSMYATIRRLFLWGAVVTAIYTLVYAFGGMSFLGLLTDDASVVASSADYLPWAVAIPAAGVAAFIWDGVFIGLTATRGMMYTLLLSALVFFASYMLFGPRWGNHALWLSFVAYLFMRGVIQTVLFSFYKKRDALSC